MVATHLWVVYPNTTTTYRTKHHQRHFQWEGYGTALKPAIEPIILARKPISEKNIALNVLKHGTGGLNIDGTMHRYRNGWLGW